MTKPHFTFWVLGALALVWNAMGCINYIMQTNPDAVAQMPELYQSVITGRPAWATAGFALHVFAGALAAILLLVRRKIAASVFFLSFVAGVIFFVFILQLVLSNGLPTAIVGGPILSLAVILLMTWYARMSARRGWIS